MYFKIISIRFAYWASDEMRIYVVGVAQTTISSIWLAGSAWSSVDARAGFHASAMIEIVRVSRKCAHLSIASATCW